MGWKWKNPAPVEAQDRNLLLKVAAYRHAMTETLMVPNMANTVAMV